MARRMRRVAVVAAIAAVVTVAPGTAYASEPADLVDPAQQGSLVDVGNATAAAESDANMKNDGMPLSAGASVNGCSGAMTKPAPEADTTSPTSVAIAARFSFQCLLSSGGSETFRIEYSTLDGWRTLTSVPVTVPGEGGIAGRPISGACRAGTWHYRGRATGTVNFVTASVAVTCVRASDPLFIDPA